MGGPGEQDGRGDWLVAAEPILEGLPDAVIAAGRTGSSSGSPRALGFALGHADYRANAAGRGRNELFE